ncbi:hypothetical protein GUITHDRAFT_143783 [Guillardia theta CCMP2712]|uniref:Uncharacterized protein n=2 Tax=Guillardia theta TaxID=55529 RepID=L1IRV1_GUITC|nr:hypothetical protein GUITHDRAFT_143783 [Guillardia theta CCMP2712]EKX38968.1 hypothetical protein GUITHDRAFT_143783 [Guillardia theta CCMP2712]|eukprot:XP_005825948.1 hypothetical protein GUITHDRAFT_143783 [Guillardia theta CCMP2712]
MHVEAMLRSSTVLFVLALSGLVSVAILHRYSAQHELVSMDSSPEAQRVQEGHMYSRMQRLNNRLQTENQNLRSLLQMGREASSDMADFSESKRARMHGIELNGNGFRGRDRARGDGRQSGDLRFDGEDEAVDDLLRTAKEEADSKLGVKEGRAGRKSRDSELEQDADDALEHTLKQWKYPLQDTHQRISRRQQSRASRYNSRHRRRLRRMEARRYRRKMREAETDLRHGHPHRAQRAAMHALSNHEREEELRGFVGEAVDRKPEAWKLLMKTINDDISDHAVTQRVENNMKDVVELRRDVESAKHLYEENKRLYMHDITNKGRLGLMLTIPSRDGGMKAVNHIAHKLEHELNDQERAWDRADSLENAKVDVARELREEEIGRSLKKQQQMQRTTLPPLSASSSNPPKLQSNVQQLRDVNVPIKTAMAAPQLSSAEARGNFAPSATTTPQGFSASVAHGCEGCQQYSHSGHACASCPQPQQPQESRQEAAAPTGQPGTQKPAKISSSLLSKFRVYHIPSNQLGTQDMAIRSKWEGLKRKNRLRLMGAAKDLPDQPREVSNDIVERLLKLAHAGKLRSPDEFGYVRHPISDAIKSHRQDEQELRVAHDLYREREMSRREHRDRLHKLRQTQDKAVAQPRQPAPPVPQAEVRPKEQEPVRPRPSSISPSPALARRTEEQAQPREHWKRPSAASGLWGIVSAPFNALFGDSVIHKTYLPT